MIAMIMSDERVIALAIWVITGLLCLISVMGAFGIKIYIAIQKRRSAKVAELFDEIREFRDKLVDVKEEVADMSTKLHVFIEEVVSLKNNVSKITDDMHNVKADIRVIKSTLKI